MEGKVQIKLRLEKKEIRVTISKTDNRLITEINGTKPSSLEPVLGNERGTSLYNL